MKDLSVLILSYNTEDLTRQCLDALTASLSQTKLQSEIIVIDNASSDGSPQMLAEYKKKHHSDRVQLIVEYNRKNNGFTGGNNQALVLATGKYILYLNSDVIIDNMDFSVLLAYLEDHEQVGGLTVEVMLPTGKLDPACHRGFPTPWNAATYFLKLEKLFGTVPGINRLVGGYHMTYRDMRKIHEIDAPAAAFYLTRKEIVDKLKGFDADNFFAYGEDIDLTYRTKELGYSIIYYPHFRVIHHKWSSGLKSKDPVVRHRTQMYFNSAMKTFYKKHYDKKYPRLVNIIMYFLMDVKSKM